MLDEMRRLAWMRIVLASLVVGHVALVVYSSRRNYVTVQEVRAVPAGLRHWEAGDFSPACDQPPLARSLAVVPLLLAGGSGFETADPGSSPDADALLGQLYAAADPDHYFDHIRLARLMGVAWSLLGMGVVYRWARQLYGRRAGVFAVALWCTVPSVLAYAPLATADLPAAVSGLVATYAFWCYLRRPTWGRALLAGVLLGVAQLAEFHLLLLYVIWPCLWIVYRATGFAERQPETIGQGSAAANTRAQQTVSALLKRFLPSLSAFGQGVAGIGLSLLVINQGYGWENTGRPLGRLSFVSRALGGDARDHPFSDTAFARLPVPLPESYVVGLDRRRHDAETGLPSYGFPYSTAPEWFSPGWGDFGIRAVLVKVPLAAWVLLCWSLFLGLTGRCNGRRADEAMVWVALLVIFVAAAGHWGFRFPIHTALLLAPFAIVAMSKVGSFLKRESWKAGGLALASYLWLTASSLLVYPHSLAYANELAGGPGNPEAARLHGNWDCGQDLLYLREWAQAHPEARPLRIAYCNTLDRDLAYFNYFWPPLNSGNVQRMDPLCAQAAGPLPGYFALDLFHRSLSVYQYFHHFQPIARAGYSIFIYHITTESANDVRRQIGLPPVSTTGIPADGSARGFVHRVFQDAKGRNRKYVVFIPAGYQEAEAYPLILFLHGFGKAGTDGVAQLVDGLAPFIRHELQTFPFITVFPQGPEGKWLPDSDETKLVMDILAEVQKDYHVDPRRIFVTGISSGGTGAWVLAALYPERWAAVIPIAGSFSDFAAVQRLKQIPCWCFHNANDATSSVERPRRMIAALRSAGGEPKYTELVSLARSGLPNHNAWDKAYALPLLYDWLLQRRLPAINGAPEDGK